MEASNLVGERKSQLEKEIIKRYASLLLTEIDSKEEGLEYINVLETDSAVVRTQKIEQNRKIAEEREKLYLQKDTEMLKALENIKKRIREVVYPAENNNKAPNNNPNNPNAKQDLLPPQATSEPKLAFTCECGNRDESYVFDDEKNGNRVCLGKNGGGCGLILQSRVVNRGADKRNFEGEEDRNHHGIGLDNMMSDAWNLSTDMVRPEGVSQSKFKRFLELANEAELKCEDREDRRTSQKYKDNHKREAFKKMDELCFSLNLQGIFLKRAKEIFFTYRQIRESVHDFDLVIPAIILIAFEDIASKMKGDLVYFNNNTGVHSDVGSLTSKYSDVIKPRAEMSQDPVISTVPSNSLSKFNIAEVREWLEAVCDEYKIKQNLDTSISSIHLTFSVEKIIESIESKLAKENQSASSSLDKSKGKPVSVDNSLFIPKSYNAQDNQTITAGKILFLSDIQEILSPNNKKESVGSLGLSLEKEAVDQIVQIFKDAVISRTRYDTLLAQYEQRKELERRRLVGQENKEKSKKRPFSELEKSQSTSSKLGSVFSQVTSDSIEEANEFQPEDIDLEDLIGGPIKIVKDSGPLPTIHKSPTKSSIPQVKKMSPIKQEEIKVSKFPELTETTSSLPQPEQPKTARPRFKIAK